MPNTEQTNQPSEVEPHIPTPEDQLRLIVHRSELALERRANVFVWWPTRRLVACLNSHVTPVTVQTLLRWLGMPSEPRRDGQVVIMKRIWLDHEDTLSYSPQPLPDSEPLESSYILTEGLYGCFLKDSEDPTEVPKAVPWVPLTPAGSFRALQEARLKDLRLCDVTGASINNYFRTMKIHDAIRDKFEGSRDKCAFTGSTNGSGAAAVDLHWIFPPYMYNYNDTKGAPRDYDISSGKVRHSEDNLLPMCAAVHELWYENEFSVDVEDGYRIRTFTQAAVDMGLPERLIAPNPKRESFFREHFLHTTLIRISGGDIHSQDGIHEMYLKVGACMADLDDYGRKIDPTDEIWKSEVGKDALELVDPEDLLPDISGLSERDRDASEAAWSNGRRRLPDPLYNL
ncbi:hypothetical protein VTO73DRAFT_11506 [Trametes versicolor]